MAKKHLVLAIPSQDWRALAEQARNQERTPEQQAAFIIRQAVKAQARERVPA